MFQNKTYQPYLVIVLLISVAFIFHFKTINEFPQYKHCWAQCDRYAIAQGFIDNGGDLFHPQTYVYNNQFPDDFQNIKDNTITSVDFPIHDYIVSWLMKIGHTKSPWVFKLYILLYSLIGFFYLYKLTTLFTSSFFQQLAIVLLAISSPTILYFQAGFLPTIPSLANAFIALYFYFSYVKSGQAKQFKLAIFFITLAALARLPFAIGLIAICAVECIKLLKYKKKQAFKIISIFISVTSIIAYYVYNAYLRNQYGSLFLNYIIPAESFSVFIDYLVAVYDRWMFQYFSHLHYVILGFLILAFIFNYVRKKITLGATEKLLILLVGIQFLGCCMFYALMSFQFLNHDYYFLDTFYIPCILLILFLIIKLPIFTNPFFVRISVSLVLIGSVPLFLYAQQIQFQQRHLEFYKEKTTAENFAQAELLLEALHISKQAKILVMGSDGVNNPFLLMQRKGYTVMEIWKPDRIKQALGWPYDYVVLENTKLINQLYPVYPNIINELLKIGGNENISIYIKKTINERSDMDAFFGLNTRPKKYRQCINFDTIPENCSNTATSSRYVFSGNKSGVVDSLSEYGFTHYIHHFENMSKQPTILKIAGQFFSQQPLRELLLCVSIKNKEKDILFKTNDLQSLIIPENWGKQELLFSLPKIDDKEQEMGIFIWNTKKNTVYYDDIEITIY